VWSRQACVSSAARLPRDHVLLLSETTTPLTRDAVQTDLRWVGVYSDSVPNDWWSEWFQISSADVSVIYSRRVATTCFTDAGRRTWSNSSPVDFR